MAELLPNWMQENCYSAQIDRLMLANVVCGDGVADVVGGSLLVTTGGSGLNVSVAQGGAWVEGDDDDRGMYSVYNDAAVTVTVGAADPTNPRIDQIIARVYDSTYGEGADEWVLEVLAGTATAGATLTNLNGAASISGLNAITLAYVLVPATFVGPFVDATHIKDARTEFVSCGAPMPPYVDLVSTAVTSIPHNAATKVNLATTAHNDDEFFTVAASVVTVLKAGVYDIEGIGGFATSGVTADLELAVGLNGLTALPGCHLAVSNVVLLIGRVGRMLVSLAAGDTLQLRCYQFQSSGSAAVNTVGSGASRLTVRKVG